MNKVKLEEICEVNIGKTPARKNEKYWGKGHKWVSISDMDSKYISETKEEITDLAINEIKIKLVPKNTVMMSFKLSIGKVAISAEPLYTNEAIAHFIPKSNRVLTEYLYYVLQFVDYEPYMNQAAKGKTLNKKSLKRVEIPLFSLETQKKIVKMLDEIAEVIDLREKQLQELDFLIQSIFYEMFGNPINDFKVDYENYKLEDLTVNIFGGGTPKKKHNEYYDSGEILWITPKDMKQKYLNDSQIKITEEGLNNSSAKLVPKNSLLMVIRSGILKKYVPLAINVKETTVNQDMKAFVLKENCNVKFIYSYVKSVEKVLLSKVRSVTADNLNFKDVKNLNIKLPSIYYQNKYAEKVEEIERTKEKMQTSLNEMNMLFDTLMQKAFTGELV